MSGQPSSSAAQAVESALRRAILTLELRPGSRLSEHDLAQRHGVSRQPVREALIGLARMRLVEILPQRGTVVSRISVAKLMEARFVREAVETAVARRACEHFNPEQRRRTGDLLAIQEQAAARGDHDGFARADHAFHVALAEGAGCGLAWEALRDIKAHLDRACQLTVPDAEAMLHLVGQHRAIMDAVDRRDPDGAAETMRLHLTEILRALPRAEAEHPELFE